MRTAKKELFGRRAIRTTKTTTEVVGIITNELRGAKSQANRQKILSVLVETVWLKSRADDSFIMLRIIPCRERKAKGDL